MCENKMEMFPQIEINKYSKEKTSSDKKYIIVFLLVFMLSHGVASSALESDSGLLSFFNALFGPVIITSAMAWCAIDYMHRESKTMHIGWYISFLLFVPVALPIYLIKTRGWKKGGALFLKALLILVLAAFIFVLGGGIANMLINT